MVDLCLQLSLINNPMNLLLRGLRKSAMNILILTMNVLIYREYANLHEYTDLTTKAR